MTDTLRFSFWSWSKLKACAKQYKLQVIDFTKLVERDEGNAMQGTIPHAQSEAFFRLPINERDVNFFLETLPGFWDKFINDKDKEGKLKNPVDWVKVGEKFAKQNKQKIAKDHLSQYGYDLKYEETRNVARNMAQMVFQNQWYRYPARTEVKFKAEVEPRVDGVNPRPSIVLTGLIDLELETPLGWELWDWKATAKENSDIDQLIIYQMASRANGRVPHRVGFAYLKKLKLHHEHILPVHELKLRTLMRQLAPMAERAGYPADFASWKCNMCDVKNLCDAYQRHKDKKSLIPVSALRPGKISLGTLSNLEENVSTTVPSFEQGGTDIDKLLSGKE